MSWMVGTISYIELLMALFEMCRIERHEPLLANPSLLLHLSRDVVRHAAQIANLGSRIFYAATALCIPMHFVHSVFEVGRQSSMAMLWACMQ